MSATRRTRAGTDSMPGKGAKMLPFHYPRFGVIGLDAQPSCSVPRGLIV